MHYAPLSWRDALRAHCDAHGLFTMKEIAAAVGANVSTIEDWFKREKWRPMHNDKKGALIRLFNLNGEDELINLEKVPPRVRDAGAGSGPIDWTSVRGGEMPLEVLYAELHHRGVSVHVIAEVDAQIRHPPPPREPA